MFSSRVVRWARLDRLRRKPGVSDRAVALVFTGRFTDEVLSGAWSVLSPTFRTAFGLSLVQVGLLSQVVEWVALAVEPFAAAQVDLRERRSIMAFGAFALAGSVLLMGIAPNYAVLIAGFALYGLGSGPLALSADVVVVETFPDAPERAFGRATFLDTVGALAGPALVALVAAAGVSWRVVLVVLAGFVVAYGVAFTATPLPAPLRNGDAEHGGLRQLLANGRIVMADAGARQWFLVLLCFDLFEASFVLKYIWLHDTVGLSQPLVGAYAALEQVVDMVALLLLDRWLARRDPGQIFRAAATALVILPTAWVAAPGLAGRIAVGIPLAFAHTIIWPVAKAKSLTAVPELGGATQAITALFPIVPFALGQARLATAIGVGPAMATTATAGAVLMLAAARPQRGSRADGSAGV